MIINARAVVATTLLSLFCAGSTAMAQDHLTDYDAWLEWAELGPYQPEVEDWDAIYQAALREPPLVIYSATSRITPSVERMIEQYPGLKIEAINISTHEANERVRREWDADLHEVGVLFSGAPEYHAEQLLPINALTRYVPRGVEELLPPAETHPLPPQRYVAGVWVYSTDGDPRIPPYSNVWELTTEKWRGKIAIWDVFETDTSSGYFMATIHHADRMEALYEDYFGQPIELTTDNAGLEFMKRLLENDMRIFSDHRDVARAVTEAEGDFAGLTTSSAYRLVLDGEAEFEIDHTVAPTAGSYNTVAIGSMTQSPNTAKLVTRWLLSQEGGAEWWGPNFPAPQGIMPEEEGWLTIADFGDRWWEVPLDLRTALFDEVVDHWLLWR